MCFVDLRQEILLRKEVFNSMTKQRVLISLDSSEFSKSISDEICHLFLPKQFKLEFLRVATPPKSALKQQKETYDDDWLLFQEWISDSSTAPETDTQKLEQSLASELKTVAEFFQNKGYEVGTSIRFGKATDEIIRFAEEENIDLIAMATHAHTGLKRLRLGSVAQDVLKQSHIPVLMVRPVARTTKGAATFSTARHQPVSVS